MLVTKITASPNVDISKQNELAKRGNNPCSLVFGLCKMMIFEILPNTLFEKRREIQIFETWNKVTANLHHYDPPPQGPPGGDFGVTLVPQSNIDIHSNLYEAAAASSHCRNQNSFHDFFTFSQKNPIFPENFFTFCKSQPSLNCTFFII